MEFKEIDRETATTILNLSNLPERSMCTTLDKFYSDYSCDGGIYVINNDRIGEKSIFGQIYQSCCGNKCDYVAKWQPNIDEALNEAKMQITVSEYGLAPKIREVWRCPEGVIIIMDALSITAKRELQKLRREQIDNFVNKYKPIFKEKLKYLQIMLKEEFMDLKQLIEEDSPSIGDFKNFKQKYNEICKENKLNPRMYLTGELSVDTPDTDEQKEERFLILDNLVNLLKTLHQHNIIHGDSHLNNFMRSQDDSDFKLIDFGMAKISPKEEEQFNDFVKLGTALTLLTVTYKNLQYLADHYYG
jgi:serine/threonine protein kinase